MANLRITIAGFGDADRLEVNKPPAQF